MRRVLTLRVPYKANTYFRYWFATWPKGFSEIAGLSFGDVYAFRNWADDKYPGWREHVSRVELRYPYYEIQ